jgi:hypothetical protein
MFIGRANTAPQVSLDKPPLIGGLGVESGHRFIGPLSHWVI